MSTAAQQHDPVPAEDTRPITHVIETLEGLADNGPISVSDLMHKFGRTAYAPLLLIPALLLVSPLSGLPFYSSLSGILIFLIAIQGALGRRSIWLPDRLKRLTLSEGRAHRAAKSLARAGAYVDRLTRRRFVFLVSVVMQHVLYLLISVVAICLPFLELVPFTSSLVGGGVSLIAVGILARDGLFVVAGAGVFGIAAMIPLSIYGAVT